jgi:signal peptidase II
MEGTGMMLVAAGVAAAATVAIDQGTKALVRGSMDQGEIHRADTHGQFSIGHIENNGSAYGIIGDLPTWAPVLGTAVIGGAMLALNRGSRHSVLAGIGAGMVIGGGVGNAIDRMHQGTVTDFIHTTNAFGFYNVADIGITAGMGAAGLAFVLSR